MSALAGVALMLCALYALLWLFKSRRFDKHVDQALAINAGPPPHSCEVCEDLTDDAVNYGFDEITEDGLSPAEYRRLKRVGALFGNPSGVQPPVVPGRDDQ